MSRPDPDSLLKELKSQEKNLQGKLKIFLGYAAGVGKTYAMLQAAKLLKEEGIKVAAGWIEPHDRPDTLALTQEIDSVPPLKLSHLGGSLTEMDLQGCLKLKPDFLLVDELAHTNAPGSRHEKRWQDVQEILAAGINVLTTMNIQHLESMNDVVAKVTQVRVKETLPDAFFDSASEVEVVDLPPKELMQRLEEGKIYGLDQAQRALKGFFRPSNLLALRELALRRAADRVGHDVDSIRNKTNIDAIWPVHERFLVSLSPSPTSADLMRAAARMASKWGAELIAVYIETPKGRILAPQSMAQLQKNLNMAESLGAETVILQGEEVAKDLVAYARLRNVTKIVLGKNRDPRWKRLIRHTVGDELLRISGDIDLYVITGRQDQPKEPTQHLRPLIRGQIFLWSTLICAGFTLLALVLQSLLGMVEVNIVLTLLLSVVLSAGLFGLVASVYTSFLAVLSFNFFFTQPIHTLAVDNPQYYLVFLFLLVVGAVIGTLTERLALGIRTSRTREQRIESLYRLNRELSKALTLKEVQVTANVTLSSILGTPTEMWAPGLEYPTNTTAKDKPLYDWVQRNGTKAGWSTATLSGADKLVWPLTGSGGFLGLLVVHKQGLTSLERGKFVLLDSLAAGVGLALERLQLIQQSQKASTEMETERTRNALLHGLSHDLRTPLSVIAGNASALEQTASLKLSEPENKLLKSIFTETHWLTRQVDNLLSLTKLTDGKLTLKMEWLLPDEAIYSSLIRFRELFPERKITFHIPEKVPLFKADPLLLEKALMNLLENAALYSPEGSEISVKLEVDNSKILFHVLDQGPGVPQDERKSIFEKFSRGSQASLNRRGTGLGLAIVQAITFAHEGECGMFPRSTGGSDFYLSFLIPKEKPPIPEAE